MKTKTVTLIEVDYNELDKAVTKFLKDQKINWQDADHRYFCVCEQEWGNDQSHSFDVDGEVSEDEIAELRAGELSWRLGNILNWMCREGELAKGEYKIDICW